jgi:hypothetical protein
MSDDEDSNMEPAPEGGDPETGEGSRKSSGRTGCGCYGDSFAEKKKKEPVKWNAGAVRCPCGMTGYMSDQ